MADLLEASLKELVFCIWSTNVMLCIHWCTDTYNGINIVKIFAIVHKPSEEVSKITALYWNWSPSLLLCFSCVSVGTAQTQNRCWRKCRSSSPVYPTSLMGRTRDSVRRWEPTGFSQTAKILVSPTVGAISESVWNYYMSSREVVLCECTGNASEWPQQKTAQVFCSTEVLFLMCHIHLSFQFDVIPFLIGNVLCPAGFTSWTLSAALALNHTQRFTSQWFYVTFIIVYTSAPGAVTL